MTILMTIWAYIRASGFIWKLIANYKVLSEAVKCIEVNAQAMMSRDSAIPSGEEGQLMLMALSNILKTGIIDLPLVDEYQLSLDLDQITGQMRIAINDSASGKYNSLVIGKK